MATKTTKEAPKKTTKPAAKTTAKPAAKPATKAPAKAAAKPAAKAAAKPAAKAPAKTTSKASAKDAPKKGLTKLEVPKKKTEASAKTVYHVSKRDNNGREWKVFIQGGDKVIKLFDTQAEALKYAKSLADNKHIHS